MLSKAVLPRHVADFAPLSAEAVVRGHKAGLLSVQDYNNLCQCETLDDIKLHLVRCLPAAAPARKLQLPPARFKQADMRLLQGTSCLQTAC